MAGNSSVSVQGSLQLGTAQRTADWGQLAGHRTDQRDTEMLDYPFASVGKSVQKIYRVIRCCDKRPEPKQARADALLSADICLCVISPQTWWSRGRAAFLAAGE